MDYERIIGPPRSERLKSGQVKLKANENVGKHVTEDKEELLVVLKGTATVLEPGKETRVAAAETHYIPRGTEHDVRNDGEEELEYVYVVSLL